MHEYRSSHGGSNGRGNEQHNDYAGSGGGDYFSFQPFNMFNDLFGSGVSQSFRPTVTGSVIHAREVMFPYDPIITSDGYYALLDLTCSMVVFEGSPREFLATYESTNDMSIASQLHGPQLFSTPGHASLGGACFAGLNDRGDLQVVAGHPTHYQTTLLWSTGEAEGGNEYFTSFFRRYYLELSDTGELSVRMLAAGSGDEVCVWSTRSCNSVLSALLSIQHSVASNIGKLFPPIRNIFATIRRILQYISNVMAESTLLARVQELSDKLWSNVLRLLSEYDIFPDEGRREERNRSARRRRREAYFTNH